VILSFAIVSIDEEPPYAWGFNQYGSALVKSLFPSACRADVQSENHKCAKSR
jgi:hypothetical protein